MAARTIFIKGSMGERNVVRYINIFLIILALAVLALLAREFTAVAPPLQVAASGRGGSSGMKGFSKGRGFTDYALIGTSGLLGVKTTLRPMRSSPMRTGPASPAVTASGSGVTLLGTVTGSGGNDFAVFKEKSSGKEEVVRRGEKVFNIGTLASVGKYRATVESNGAKISFAMDLSEKERAMMESPNRPGLESLIGPGGARGRVNPFTGRTMKHLARPLGKGKWLVDKRALDDALKDSSRVLSDARFIPYRDGGVVKGFLLSQVRPYGIFYEMGIRSGDIILRVNDYAIDAPEKAMSLMKGLKGETDVTVDLLRRGRAETFKYEIR